MKLAKQTKKSLDIQLQLFNILWLIKDGLHSQLTLKDSKIALLQISKYIFMPQQLSLIPNIQKKVTWGDFFFFSVPLQNLCCPTQYFCIFSEYHCATLQYFCIPLQHFWQSFAKTLFCINWIESDFCFDISGYKNRICCHKLGKLTVILCSCIELNICLLQTAMLGCDVFILKLN